MRLPLNKFLKKLGVDHVLSPYETQPWFYYDEKHGVTCSAEVRMGPDGSDVEAEVQFLKDPDHEETEEGEGDTGGLLAQIPAGGRAQIMYLRAEPVSRIEWAPKLLRVKGKDYVNEMHGWEAKGCDFFVACIQSMSMEEIPDVDMLVEKNMTDTSGKGGGASGKVGRKSPKIKPAQVMGMGKKP